MVTLSRFFPEKKSIKLSRLETIVFIEQEYLLQTEVLHIINARLGKQRGKIKVP